LKQSKFLDKLNNIIQHKNILRKEVTL